MRRIILAICKFKNVYTILKFLFNCLIKLLIEIVKSYKLIIRILNVDVSLKKNLFEFFSIHWSKFFHNIRCKYPTILRLCKSDCFWINKTNKWTNLAKVIEPIADGERSLNIVKFKEKQMLIIFICICTIF